MIKQIEYENKQAIQNDDSIANKNKVTAEDMNEIKNVVNQNAKELETLQEDNQGNETAIGTLQNDISLIKQNNSEQDKSIQSNTSKIEAINKSIEAINKKNTEQDTNIQKNAKNIEVNQNNIKALQVENTEVKAENERLRSDIESISLLGEAEGESIDLDDSSGARFKKFGVSGNHSQETREGYNILDLSKKPYNEQASSLNGATVTQKNGILTIDATSATDLVTIKSVWTSYTNSTNIKMPKGNYYTPLILNINKAEGGESVGQKTGNITLEEDCVCVQWFYNVGKGQKIELPLFISNNQNKRTYEQYGATPSLDFPSEIKAVKDNVNVVVCNKNLQKNKWENKTSAGASSNYRSTINIDDMNLKLNKKYVIQFKCNVDYSNSTVFVENSITGESLQISKLLYDNINKINYCVIEITEAIKALINKNNCYIVIFNATGMDVNTYSEEMIFEGENKATDYEAHQEQTITMPVQQEMLKGDYFDFENEKQTNLFEKIIVDGDKIRANSIRDTSDGNFQWSFSITTKADKFRRIYSNIATQATNFGKLNGVILSNNSNNVYIKNNKDIFGDKEFSISNLNEILKKMYDTGNQVVFHIEKASNKELDFTDEQKVVAKKIKKTLHTYKNITHIYSTDETSPVLNVEYAKDLNTTISNIQALVLNNASEEVNG